MKYFVCFLLLATHSVANALTVEIESPVFSIVQPPKFVPIQRITQYSLKIDAEKSYFKIDDNPYIFNREEPIKLPVEHSISGMIGLFERFENTEFWILNETRLSSLSIQSEFDNVDLSELGFWNDNYTLVYDYVYKNPINWICSCSTMIDFDAPYIDGEFSGEELILEGGGYFKQDASDGVFQLESVFGATNYISYHIEANLVSAVPVPAAFYLFFSGMVGLVVSRARRS